ncbi:MAG TPA: DHHA1 domain-containing protein [Thermoanaerobaculia bacterium]|jgi:nanoRNase/pAp phosphatase (c-di-AMP/oligoRNAs hydrolase)|nr:DHHA1 domain-containing protein [Thermoanaerobaculia bacterium]
MPSSSVAAAATDPQARFAALAEHVRTSGRGRWLVLTHDHPDPDALASAVGLTKLLRGLGRRVTAAYGGIIGRAENREMVRVLKLKIAHVKNLPLARFGHFALVDTQPGTGNNQLPPDVVPALVLDHHPRRPASRAVGFLDIRPEYGATATMVAEYLLASGMRITSHEATALVYAIRTETRDFGREASGPDKRVYDQLLPKVRKEDLARIQHPRLPLSYFALLRQAIERLAGVDNLVVSHLPEVTQPDIVPEIADLLLRLEGKTWALATGAHGDRIYLSLRTTNGRADAGRLMRRLVAPHGRGGGHGTMAGGWVPRTGDGERQQQRLGERLARALRKDPQRLEPLRLVERPPEAPRAVDEPPAPPRV